MITLLQTEEEGTKRACFCTEPAICKASSNFITEFVGTFMLVLVIFYLTGASISLPNEANATPIGLGALGALPVAILVWALGLSLGGPTGYAINPARDLGPRLALGLMLGKKLNTSVDWGYAWIPVVAPLCAGVTAAFTYNIIM